MSTIAPAALSANAVASLPANGAAGAPASQADLGSNSGTASSHGGDRGPATDIVLSDKVKSILAKATTDQDVAERLKAFVEAHRAGGTDDTSKGSDGSRPDAKGNDVNEAFKRLTAGSREAGSADSFAPVEAAHDFSNSVQFEGFTLSVAARAQDGSFRTEMVGPNGVSFFDMRFGHSGEVTGFGGLTPGMGAASYQRGNVEYITITEKDAAALSTTVSTGAGTVSTSATATHSTQITFAIDFATGAIQATKADAWATSASAQISQTIPSLATPSVSRLA
jgi:hypothetical protein